MDIYFSPEPEQDYDPFEIALLPGGFPGAIDVLFPNKMLPETFQVSGADEIEQIVLKDDDGFYIQRFEGGMKVLSTNKRLIVGLPLYYLTKLALNSLSKGEDGKWRLKPQTSRGD